MENSKERAEPADFIRMDEDGNIQSAEGYGISFEIDKNNKPINAKWILIEDSDVIDL